jgi:hypothetical protein
MLLALLIFLVNHECDAGWALGRVENNKLCLHSFIMKDRRDTGGVRFDALESNFQPIRDVLVP